MIIGAQFYTLKAQTTTLEDFAEALARVADIGYTTVQISGTCDFAPDWLAEQLKKNDLTCVLTHAKGNEILSDPVKVCNDHKLFGCRNIGIGALPNAFSEGWITEERYNDFVTKFLPVAKTFREEGCKFFYHNHQLEFARSADGRSWFDRLLADFSPDLMGIIMDTYWVQFAGADPAQWMEKLKGRLECIHLKDMTIVGKEQRMAPVGSGNLNFDRILRAAADADVKYALVEQDKCYDEDPFDCLKKSYDYLRAQGLN